MITDHSSLTIFRCYVCFLGIAGIDCSKTDSPEDTSIFDLWLVADEYWQKMLDAGLRGMLLFEASAHVDPDKLLVDYVFDLMSRDGFVTDPSYWDDARTDWRQSLADHRSPVGRGTARHGKARRPGLRLISTECPATSPPRGICSPLKTDAMRRFEEAASDVFPGADAITTEWEVSARGCRPADPQ